MGPVTEAGKVKGSPEEKKKKQGWRREWRDMEVSDGPRGTALVTLFPSSTSSPPHPILSPNVGTYSLALTLS